ncbi:hypothetical protein AKJ16_DCAP03718, partial [Drosera capensis]
HIVMEVEDGSQPIDNELVALCAFEEDYFANRVCKNMNLVDVYDHLMDKYRWINPLFMRLRYVMPEMNIYVTLVDDRDVANICQVYACVKLDVIRMEVMKKLNSPTPRIFDSRNHLPPSFHSLISFHSRFLSIAIIVSNSGDPVVFLSMKSARRQHGEAYASTPLREESRLSGWDRFEFFGRLNCSVVKEETMMWRHREWMYQIVEGRSLRNTFVQGADEFIRFATSIDIRNNPGSMKCPCVRCDCVPFLSIEQVKIHLYKYGCRPGYHVWDYHDETDTSQPNQEVTSTSIGYTQVTNSYRDMVINGYAPMSSHESQRIDDDVSRPETREFYEMLTM